MKEEENRTSVFEEFIQLCEDNNLTVTLSHGDSVFGFTKKHVDDTGGYRDHDVI